MDLVLVVLTEPASTAGPGLSPQILGDILWANALPADGLQHVNVRAGPEPGSHIIGLFLLPGPPDFPDFPDTDGDAASRALRVCRRAVQAAPALAGCTVARLCLERTSIKRTS